MNIKLERRLILGNWARGIHSNKLSINSDIEGELMKMMMMQKMMKKMKKMFTMNKILRMILIALKKLRKMPLR